MMTKKGHNLKKNFIPIALITIVAIFVGTVNATSIDIKDVTEGGTYNHAVSPIIEFFGNNPDAIFSITLDGLPYQGEWINTSDMKASPPNFLWDFTGIPIYYEGSHTLVVSSSDSANIITVNFNIDFDNTPALSIKQLTTDGTNKDPQIDRALLDKQIVWVSNDKQILLYNMVTDTTKDIIAEIDSLRGTSLGGYNHKPQIDKGTIVWTNSKNIYTESGEIYGYNSSADSPTDKFIFVSSVMGVDNGYNVRIENGNIVWIDNNLGEYSVYFYKPDPIIDHWLGYGNYVDTDDGQILWYGRFDYNNDKQLYLYNLSTNKFFQISEYGNADIYDPKIRDGLAVWRIPDPSYGHPDASALRIYDISTNSYKRISQSLPIDEFQTSNGKIVWRAFDGNDWEIYLYNGTSIVNITNNNYDDKQPQISNDGSTVVWSGFDGKDYEIFTYDINSGEITQITSNDYNDTQPQISSAGQLSGQLGFGEDIVWNGNGDIFQWSKPYPIPLCWKDGKFDPLCRSTPAGDGISISLPSLYITFDKIVGAGETIETDSKIGPAIPIGFNLITDYYDIETTAEYVGNIAIGIEYPAGIDESALKILHYENNEWKDITSSVDTNSNIIYGITNSLSPFVVVESINQPPVAEAGGPYTVDEGSSVTLDGSGSTDPSGDSLTYAWDLNNDGTYETSGRTASITPKDGPETLIVGLQVSDGKGGIGTDTATINVNNVAPTIDSLESDKYLAPVNTAITGTSKFHDPGILDTFTAVWNWEDGIDTQSLSAGSTSTTDSHSYNTPGVYTVSLKITDKDGGLDTENIPQYIVIYDPSAGFVTGGGWIDSPAGAYIADPKLIGKANFGFVSKYQKGVNTPPTGQTEFQFHAGDLDFHSTSYDWLVVAGARAQYKGNGTINGTGDYEFMLTAIDGQISGGGGTDKFRIKIKDKNNAGAVVYDNQLGAADDAMLTTVIQGGSIVIHS